MREAREDEADRARFPLRVRVGRPGGEALIDDGLAVWIPARDEGSNNAMARLDRVVLELEVPHVGPTYDLMFSRPNDAQEGYRHVTLRSDTPVDAVEVFPQHGGTPFGSSEDEWDWQSGW